ncbi:MAG: hypothetical protein JZU53_09840 [Paludibacter sp.]|nr:hypothetical protein [Paludibacter sp.]
MKDTLYIDSIGKLKEIVLNTNITLHSEKIKESRETIFQLPESLARILIPALITLAVFLLGQIIIWFRNQKNIQNETNNYKKIILSWADLIKKPVEKQVSECRDLSLRIRNSQTINPERFGLIKMLANKVDSISIERFISTFMINSTNPKVDNKNEKMTFHIVSQLDYLMSMEKSIAETYKAYQDEINMIMDQWNDKFFTLTKIIDDWSKKINNQHEYSNFQQELRRISVNWTRTAPDGRSTMIHSVNQLITPLSALVSAELNANINNEYAFLLSETLQHLRIVDLKWGACINGYSTVFNDIADDIEASLNALNDAKTYFLTKTKTKNIFLIGKSK